MSLWPFRTGNDDRFQTSYAQDSIYDSLQQHDGDIPAHAYPTEVDRYLEWRWRRGAIQSVLPTTCYGAVGGFCLGFRQSRLDGRYIGRYRVIWRYTSTFAAVGFLTTFVHHYLVVSSNYKDAPHYPLIAGGTGAAMLCLAGQMGSLTLGVLAGSLVGFLYSLACFGGTYYRRRHLGTFLHEQQLQQVPIHRVSPELQPMYRAYLFDNRPVEEKEKARHEAVLLSRQDDEDYRIDAVSIKQNMFPEVFDWVNFPDWWPVKWPAYSDEALVMLERQRREEVARKTKKMIEMDDGTFLKRRNRFKEHRDA